MDVYLEDGTRVRLGQAEFVGQGGQASVYVVGDRAFKVYADPDTMPPTAKLRELAALTHPTILRPEALLLDEQQQPVGFTMRRVAEGTVLCRLFNRAFRERKGLTPDAVLALVRKLQVGVQHVHDQGILIVDLNEMNFLLDAELREVLFIDVDSYQTPGFSATAIMETIRDRHANAFSRETDWFSFGIVSFQMLVGVHPYRGKHPVLPDLDSRMQANVSVFNPQVSTPAVCYPLDSIPRAYRDWYRAVFEDGKRLPPPRDVHHAIELLPVAAPLAAAGKLVIEELHRFPSEILVPLPCVGTHAALTRDGLYVRGRRVAVPPDAHFAVTPRQGRLVAGWIAGRRLRLLDTGDGKAIEPAPEAEALMSYGDRLYVKQGATVGEVRFLELPAELRATVQPVGNVLEQATALHDGCALQNLLGAWYALLFPRPGACYPVRLRELDPYRVIDARFDGGVLAVIASRDGRFDRFVFRFDPEFRSYDVRVTTDVTTTGAEIVALSNGVCLRLDGAELEIFSSRKGADELRVLHEPALAGARLARNGSQALFFRERVLYQMKLGP
jgi:hypothetical protein